MDEKDFEGTLVLEKLAEIGKVEEFFEAIDSDDIKQVRALLKLAGIPKHEIDLVIEEIIGQG